MIKLTQYVHPETSIVWCVHIEYMQDNKPVCYSHYVSEDIDNALHPDTLEKLKEQTGQSIAMIIINEYPS